MRDLIGIAAQRKANAVPVLRTDKPTSISGAISNVKFTEFELAALERFKDINDLYGILNSSFLRGMKAGKWFLYATKIYPDRSEFDVIRRDGKLITLNLKDIGSLKHTWKTYRINPDISPIMAERQTMLSVVTDICKDEWGFISGKLVLHSSVSPMHFDSIEVHPVYSCSDSKVNRKDIEAKDGQLLIGKKKKIVRGRFNKNKHVIAFTPSDPYKDFNPLSPKYFCRISFTCSERIWERLKSRSIFDISTVYSVTYIDNTVKMDVELKEQNMEMLSELFSWANRRRPLKDYKEEFIVPPCCAFQHKGSEIYNEGENTMPLLQTRDDFEMVRLFYMKNLTDGNQKDKIRKACAYVAMLEQCAF